MLKRLIASQPVGLKPADISSAMETSIWALMVAVLLEFAGIVLMPDHMFRWLSTIGAVYAVCLPALVLNRRGYTGTAGVLMVTGVWAIVTVLCVTAGGLSA